MKKMYTIGQVSELFDLPKSTIRYWDEQGLIRSSRQEENDYRLFDIDDIFMLYDIVFYRKIRYTDQTDEEFIWKNIDGVI